MLSPRGGQEGGRQGLVQRLRRRVLAVSEAQPAVGTSTGALAADWDFVATAAPIKGYWSGEVKPGSTGFMTSAPTTDMVFSPLIFN